MAAKAPVKKAAPKKAVVKASKAKAKVKYTKAQQQAYTAASKAAVVKARFVSNVAAIQKRRAIKVARSKATVHRVKLYVKSARGKAAVVRLHNQSVQANFAAIRSRTTTVQQAVNMEQRALIAASKRAAARKPAAKVAKKTAAPRKKSPYAAIGAKAGAAAAARVPASKKAAPSKTRTAARVTPAVNADWITAGNDEEVENCVAVAIANHLLLQTGYRVSSTELNHIAYRDSIWKALTLLDDRGDLWKGVGFSEYGMIAPEEAEPGDIVGFDVKVNGKRFSHCGVLMPESKVISWGQVIALESKVDEAWQVIWTVTSR